MPDSLEKFKYTLPYASEAFGVYQPLLGWRSKRALDRFTAGLEAQEESLFKLIQGVLTPKFHILDVHFVNPSPVFCLDKTGDCSHPKATHMSVLPGSRQGSRLCQSLMLLQ